MNSKKILILNDGSAYENWGIKACIDGLYKIFKETELNLEIKGIPHSYMHQRYSYNPKIFGRPVFLDNNRLAKKFLSVFHLLPRIADEYEYVAKKWLSGKGGPGARDFISRVKDFDVVVFNAEGSTYRDNIGAIKGLFMLWFAKTKLNKQAFFMNGSVTLTSVDAILPAMIKKVFSVVDFVSVREKSSFDCVISYYPELAKKMKVVPDSVFALDVKKNTQKINLPFGQEDFFVFSLSMLPMDCLRNNSSIIKLIKDLKKIVPNVVLLAKDVEDQILKDIAKKTGAFFVGPNYKYEEVIDLLSKAKFLISGRYHHLIFATMAGCPVIPLHTSSHKIFGLQQFFINTMPVPVDPTDLLSETDKILNYAKDILEGCNSLRNEYVEHVKKLKQNTIEQSNIIKNILIN